MINFRRRKLKRNCLPDFFGSKKFIKNFFSSNKCFFFHIVLYAYFWVFRDFPLLWSYVFIWFLFILSCSGTSTHAHSLTLTLSSHCLILLSLSLFHSLFLKNHGGGKGPDSLLLPIQIS